MDFTMPESKRTADVIEDPEKKEGAGRIPPPDDLGPASPESIADSFEEDTRKQLNLLRERTFNPELKTLVDRVRVNEPPVDGPVADPGRAVSMTDDTFELELYRLYYKARGLRDNGEINIAFNPFEMNREAADVSIQYSLATYIVERMRDLAFSPFALLSYNVSLKAFAPTIHTLDAYSVENISVSLRDGLFREILSHPEGIIINDERIHFDPFLAKIFAHKTGEAPRPVYFNMLSGITAGIMKDLPLEGTASVSPFLPSAILMIELSDADSPADPAVITGIIRQKLALPYFILNDCQSLVFSAKSHEDLEYVYDVLDYLFTVFLLRKDRSGLIIKSVIRENSNLPFLIKYIISKLSSTLYSDSAIVHIIQDTLIILTRNDIAGPIKEKITEYSRLFEGQFTIVEFFSKDFEDSVDIIQKFIVNN